ncbi:phosphatidylglycerophosphatase C [Dysgonomonas sp. PH5-45]|uniref:HAD family hydrolase n=1 Tax=unclassified Dysgonomonas TaxID=2630389 RepID=UPI0024731D6A|nr:MULTISPECIES: HAD family hydrolase [unclassified Dysgonomonas]MDH6354167.1 phosphatidylglycerophosphatase C [Dysgonomonas sp. PH5-45]MDH6386982.1 phosphatidylglycerophosphatase C [Dysgonomonas sp. PH5-37]
MKKRQVIAAFDFDGTITHKDTLFHFIEFYFGKKRLMMGLVRLSPHLLLFELGIVNSHKAKEKLFSFFFRGKSFDDFNSACKDYSAHIDKIVKKRAIEKINWHQSKGHKVVIISPAVSNWITPWAEKTGIDTVIGTEIEVVEGVISGRFATKSCRGQEKVNRLLEAFPNKKTYTLYAYGNSSADKELLTFSDHPTLWKI